MNILRKAKNPGWTSDQINFIVVSKSINENGMDTNLEKLVINQKNKKKIKVTTAKTNIHSLDFRGGDATTRNRHTTDFG